MANKTDAFVPAVWGNKTAGGNRGGTGTGEDATFPRAISSGCHLSSLQPFAPTFYLPKKLRYTYLHICIFPLICPGAPCYSFTRRLQAVTHSNDGQRGFGDDHLGSGAGARHGIWCPSCVQGQPSLLCVHRKVCCFKNKIPLKVVVLPADTDWGLSAG